MEFSHPLCDSSAHNDDIGPARAHHVLGRVVLLSKGVASILNADTWSHVHKGIEVFIAELAL
jgi:hypothetical protein